MILTFQKRNQASRRKSAKEAALERRKKHALSFVKKVEHSRKWINLGPKNLIHTKFEPLGPSDISKAPRLSEEKDIWPVLPGRSSDCKVSWKPKWKGAVQSGRLFGDDPEMTKLQDGPVKRSLQKTMDNRKIREKELAKKKRMDAIDEMVDRHKRKKKSWRAGDAVPRLFTNVKPDRPQTAYERRLCEQYKIPDRTQDVGVTQQWLPGCSFGREFS
eukprot:g2944.t1